MQIRRFTQGENQKRGFLHITLTLLLALAIALSNSSVVLADGDAGEHILEVEVNGIHVSLANQNEWKQGENTIVVTLKDSSGSPVNDANVEILIGPRAEEHAAPEGASAHPKQTLRMDLNLNRGIHPCLAWK